MTRILVAVAVIILVTYGLFEARKLIEGPQLTILSPLNGIATSSETVTIAGTAQNIAFLTIDDAPAQTDESGHFSETFSPPRGYTVVTVAATDRFGRRASTSVAFTTLDYCPV
jgi:Glucodextranase, domain B